MTTVGDEDLVRAAVAGDAEALAALVRRHQRAFFHFALRLVLSPADAEDLSQEAMIRVITRLDRFEGRSSFRTWAFRILVNLFLDGKRRKMENALTSFEALGAELDSLPLEPLTLSETFEPERALIVEEAKLGCMLGMLLCLDRNQRLAYVLGEVMGVPSPVAAEILDLTPESFRKRLQRARRDLTEFMNEKCGLMREENPCRCEKKTRAFIHQGWVDPQRLKFTDRRVAQLRREAPARSVELCRAEERAGQLFSDQALVDGPDLAGRLHELVTEPKLRAALNL